MEKSLKETVSELAKAWENYKNVNDNSKKSMAETAREIIAEKAKNQPTGW